MSHQNNEKLLKQFAKGKGKTLDEISIQNCVIYTRVSSKEQMDTNQSLEWQKKYCMEYAIKNELSIKGYFGGTYESAKSDERKEFTRMLKFVKASKEKISFILVYSLDRFSRTGDSAIFIASELKKTGVNIMAVTQPIDTNSHALRLPKQTLTDIFRNPFYCGFMSHNLLNGEVVKGRHPALIDEDLFLSANQLKKTDGFKVNKANDNLPLKRFVRDAENGLPFTGYIVKKKGLYYYKVNKIGVKINRSAQLMHDKFKELLSNYTIDENHIEPLKIQLHYTWENLTETNTSDKKIVSLKLNEVEEEFYNLRKRHAVGLVSLDIYEEFAAEMELKKEKLLEQYEKLNETLSNPLELIHFTCKLAANLAPVWSSGDYYQKQTFQNVLFPQGLAYDTKIEHYRTPVVNSVFAYMADASMDLRENKNRTSLKAIEKSGSVPGAGLEPAQSQ